MGGTFGLDIVGGPALRNYREAALGAVVVVEQPLQTGLPVRLIRAHTHAQHHQPVKSGAKGDGVKRHAPAHADLDRPGEVRDPFEFRVGTNVAVFLGLELHLFLG
jgi:hypothetical protein